MSVPISNVPRRVQYAPSGVGPYAFTFEILVNTDIAVYVGTSLKTLTADYTVSINTNGTGTVTLTSAATDTVTIIGARAIQRTTDFVTGGDFRANTVNQEMDSQTIFSQQLAEEVGRSFRYGPWVNTAFNSLFPDPDANKLIAWNQSGNGLTNLDPSTIVNVVGQQASFADTFTGNGSQVNFTLTRAPGSIAALDVSINGVTQVPGVDYTLSGTTLTFTTAPPAVASNILARYSEVFVETNGDAANMRYLPAGTGAVATTVQAKLRQIVSALDFGAVGDGVTDNATAFAAIKAAAESGTYIHFPKAAVSYATSVPLNFTVPVNITADPETRIKLTAAANYVIQFDYTNGGGFFDHGGMLSNFILDGNGLAVDGLSLKAVISATFENIRVTNVTRAGLHLWWAQLCNFTNFTCSDNIDGFTTVPVNGVLVDTASSSANTFVNICIEKVSGAGVEGISLINSLFLNGTSEGNDIGLVFGESTVGSLESIGNTVILMDLEVNASGDIHVLQTGTNNSFYGLAAGFQSGACLIRGSDNNFNGGLIGGIEFTATASRNNLDNVNFIGATATLVDGGTGNNWSDIFNISTAATIRAKSKGRNNFVLSNGQTATIDASKGEYNVVTCLGATATIAEPINPTDGQELVICIHNNSAGALTVTWNAIFQKSGWVDPGVQTNRTIVFRYDANYGKWYMVSVTAADVQNY